MATPHVGQATLRNIAGVMSFMRMRTGCAKTCRKAVRFETLRKGLAGKDWPERTEPSEGELRTGLSISRWTAVPDKRCGTRTTILSSYNCLRSPLVLVSSLTGRTSILPT